MDDAEELYKMCIRDRLFSIPGSEFGEMTNPIANLSLPGAKNWSHKFVANFSAELQLWDNLRFKTSYGADLSFWGNDGYTPLYYLRSGGASSRSTAYSEKHDGTVWQLENVLMYDKTIDKHTFSVLLGQSAKKNTGSYLRGTRNNIINYSRPYLNASTGQAADGDQTAAGAPSEIATLASLFARASYNYDERYMFQVTIRRDGSSRFGSNNHYAVFPSFSLGWNLTNEKFMQKRPESVSYTHLNGIGIAYVTKGYSLDLKNRDKETLDLKPGDKIMNAKFKDGNLQPVSYTHLYH